MLKKPQIIEIQDIVKKDLEIFSSYNMDKKYFSINHRNYIIGDYYILMEQYGYFTFIDRIYYNTHANLRYDKIDEIKKIIEDLSIYKDKNIIFETKFEIGEQVKIKQSNVIGTIKSISSKDYDLYYLVNGNDYKQNELTNEF